MKRLFVTLIFLLLVGCNSANDFLSSESISLETPILSSTVTVTPSPTVTLIPTPSLTPTLIPSNDYDLDGLTNYDEITIYLTDPRNSDSDNDGIIDNEWDERREFTYSIRAIVKIRQPFDLDSMDDNYQDVRLIQEEDQRGYTTIEIIVYPDINPKYGCTPYTNIDYSNDLNKYIEPGVSTNYSPDMQEEVREIIKFEESDCSVVGRIITWVQNDTDLYLEESFPEVFFTYIEEDNVKVTNKFYEHIRYHGNYSPEEILENQYFGDSMFKNRKHGSCTSIANLQCTMIKAAGIPCRLIQTVSLKFSHRFQTEPYENNMIREWEELSNFEDLTDNMTANHAFIEVYLDGQWIRFDGAANVMVGGNGLSIKLLSTSDWSLVDFSRTWITDWVYQRPYYTNLIDDKYGPHMGKDYTSFSSAEDVYVPE